MSDILNVVPKFSKSLKLSILTIYIFPVVQFFFKISSEDYNYFLVCIKFTKHVFRKYIGLQFVVYIGETHISSFLKDIIILVSCTSFKLTYNKINCLPLNLHFNMFPLNLESDWNASLL